jgi:transcriptional regulator with XRE-family HTH domain
MAEDQDRATRIAELKERHPRLTWAKIAEQVGVTERAATQWKKTGALKPENAEALAQVFGVDFDYVWSGPRPDTPEMFVDRRSESSQLADRLEDAITLLREARSEQDRISGLLERQTRVLERIERATRHAHDAADRLDESVAEAGRALRAAPPRPARAAAKPARKRSPKASGQDPA